MKPLELALAARLPGTQVWVTERREQGLNDLSRPTPRRTPTRKLTRSWPLHGMHSWPGLLPLRRPDRQPLGDHEMHAQAGIDRHQPAIAQAAHSRVSVTHGPITRADVARFIAGG